MSCTPKKMPFQLPRLWKFPVIQISFSSSFKFTLPSRAFQPAKASPPTSTKKIFIPSPRISAPALSPDLRRRRRRPCPMLLRHARPGVSAAPAHSSSASAVDGVDPARCSSASAVVGIGPARCSSASTPARSSSAYAVVDVGPRPQLLRLRRRRRRPSPMLLRRARPDVSASAAPARSSSAARPPRHRAGVRLRFPPHRRGRPQTRRIRFRPRQPPPLSLAVVDRHGALFLAHSHGFLVARTRDVIGVAKEVKEKEKGKGEGCCVEGVNVVDVRIGRVEIVVVSGDQSMLAAAVGRELRLYPVATLLDKEWTN